MELSPKLETEQDDNLKPVLIRDQVLRFRARVSGFLKKPKEIQKKLQHILVKPYINTTLDFKPQ